MDEDAQKKKTDCVYFLASPLTCKKGNDCEYRHSEVARINPRDCRFWISGNCLNVNCAFRHPPLDNRPATTISSVAPSIAASKSRVPCYYFSHGFCAKGDKCAYMHGPLPAKYSVHSELVIASQGNGSLISRPVSEPSQDVPVVSENRPTCQESTLTNHVKAFGSSHEPVVMPSDTAVGIAAECSGSSEPRRRKHQALPGDELSLKTSGTERCRKACKPDDPLFPGHSTDERLCLEQAMAHQLPHIQARRLSQVNSDKNRNGIESEEFSPIGFDVLVDDGMQQVVHPDETHDTSQYDMTMESGMDLSRGRKLLSDSLAGYENDYPGMCDRDMPSDRYDNGSHGLYQRTSDQLRSYNHCGRKQTVMNIGKVVEGTTLRDKHGIIVEEEMRYDIDPTDLRNHILRRRRLAKANRFDGDIHSQRHQQDFPLSSSTQVQKSQDCHLRQRDVHACQNTPAQEDSMSGSRRFVGRIEPVVKKRVYCDVEHSSPERVSARRSTIQCTAGDLARAERLERESRYHSLESLKDLEYTSYNVGTRAEITKDNSDFAGPKSLAQIRAEKMNAVSDRNSKASDACSPNITEPTVPQSGNLEQLKGLPESSFAGRSRTLSMAERIESSRELDFEGPRSLSAILKEKKKKTKSEIDQKLEEARGGVASKKLDSKSSVELSQGTVPSDICSGSSNKDIEDGELLPGDKASSPTHAPQSSAHGSQHSELFIKVESITEVGTPTRQAHGVASRGSNGAGELAKEMHWSPEGFDPPSGAVDGMKEMHWSPEGVGTPCGTAADDDEGFEMDDDEEDDDDFAKALGGFFP